MAGLTNIKNQALTERIEDHLFQYILDERLAVGAKLPNEYELADRFGVSRGTIREAVKLLVSRCLLYTSEAAGIPWSFAGQARLRYLCGIADAAESRSAGLGCH